MTGILLATHYDLGTALLKTAEMVAGPQEQVAALGIYGDMEPSCFGEEILKKVEEMKGGGCDQVLILLDLFGGTPCNEAMKLLKGPRLQVLTGLNLPMLLEVMMARRSHLTAEELLEMGKKSGREGILDVKEKLKEFESHGKEGF